MQIKAFKLCGIVKVPTLAIQCKNYNRDGLCL